MADAEPLAADIRPGSLVTTTYAEVEAEIGDLAKSEEDVLMYALFPNEARQYLSAHREGAEKAVFLMSEELHTVREDEAVDVGQIRELIKVIEASDVSEVVIEEGESKITVRRGFTSAAPVAHAASAPAAPAAAGCRPLRKRAERLLSPGVVEVDHRAHGRHVLLGGLAGLARLRRSG